MFYLEWIQNNSNIILAFTAILALIISFASIVLSFVSILLQKRHYKKSVKPIANISISDYEDNISIKIFNRGSGPMIIKEFIAVCEGSTKSDLIHFMPELPEDVYWTTFFEKFNGFALLPGNFINVLEFTLDPNNKIEVDFKDKVRKKLSKISLKIKYTDIYDQEMPIENKDLYWFGRYFK